MSTYMFVKELHLIFRLIFLMCVWVRKTINKQMLSSGFPLHSGSLSQFFYSLFSVLLTNSFFSKRSGQRKKIVLWRQFNQKSKSNK